jgi:hypothetical protein
MILSQKFSPSAPRRPRLGRLSDSCVNLTTSAAASTAKTISTMTTAPRVGVQLRGLGFLGSAAAESAELNAVGVSGKGGASGAIGGAAKGASVGSAFGPIGAGIGAVIGAVAGGLIHTSQYSSWLATDTNIIAVLKQLPAGFQGRTLPKQTPTATAPLTLEMIWTAIVVTQNMYGYVSPNPGHSPSDMQNEFNWVMGWIASILQCMNQNPVGATLQATVNAGNGVTFTLTFVNPGSSNSATVTQKVIIPAYLAWCTHNGAVDTQSTHCPGDAANPINQLVLELMTDYQIAQYPPPAAQPATTPKAPATVTVTTAAGSTTVAKGGNAVTTPATATHSVMTAPPPSIATAAAASSPATTADVVPVGYGYNYAGEIVPIPPGYDLGSQNYIVDSAGYIFGSANDDSLSTPALDSNSSVPGIGVPAATYTPPVATDSGTVIPVTATAGSDDTLLYIGAAVVIAFLLMRKK